MAARESSLLFSLESLMQTEKERVHQEARDVQRRRDDDLRRAAEAAERRLQAAEREREARERRVALERERERLESERLEAIKQAAIERARIEAEAHGRLREAEKEREHALRLAKIREDQRAVRYRTVSWLTSAGCALVMASSAFAYFGQISPAQERLAARSRSLLATEEQRGQLAERALAAARESNAALLKELGELRALKGASQPVAAQPGAGSGGGAVRSGPKGERQREPTVTAPPVKKVCKDDGDPLNASLCR